MPRCSSLFGTARPRPLARRWRLLLAAAPEQNTLALQGTETGPGFGGAGTHLVVDRAGNATVLSQAHLGTGSQPYVVGALVLRSVLNVVRFGPTGQEQWAVGDVPGPLVRYGAGIAVSSYFLGDPGLLGVDRRGNIYSRLPWGSPTQRRFGACSRPCAWARTRWWGAGWWWPASAPATTC